MPPQTESHDHDLRERLRLVLHILDLSLPVQTFIENGGAALGRVPFEDLRIGRAVLILWLEAVSDRLARSVEVSQVAEMQKRQQEVLRNVRLVSKNAAENVSRGCSSNLLHADSGFFRGSWCLDFARNAGFLKVMTRIDRLFVRFLLIQNLKLAAFFLQVN